MAHGIKPYGRTLAQQTIYGVQDMSELAARLGSIDTHDRRGDVVMLEDFEGTLGRWNVNTLPLGGTGTISPLRGRSGSFSARLDMMPGAGSWTELEGALPFPVLGNMGLEFSFSGILGLQHVILNFYLHDGTNFLNPYLVIGIHDDIIEILNDAWVLVTVAVGVDLLSWDNCFHTTKLVMDFTARRYVRLVLDGTTIDLSMYNLFVAPSVISPSMEILLRAVNNVAGANHMWFDDIIVTQNEP